MISALCAVVAVGSAFFYVENQPWPKGAPPKIAGKWKLVTKANPETDQCHDGWENLSTELEILQQGEYFGLVQQEIAPFYAPEVGTLKAPNNVRIKVYNTRALSPVGYAIAEGQLDTTNGQMTIHGTYKSFGYGSDQTAETGVWTAKRVGEPETKPSQISLVEQLKQINTLPGDL